MGFASEQALLSAQTPALQARPYQSRHDIVPSAHQLSRAGSRVDTKREAELQWLNFSRLELVVREQMYLH